MTFTGVWENSYGSEMNLQQFSDGYVIGTYASSTGSTGTYYVIGFANPVNPSPTMGQSVALSIYWRSIDPGPADPSWHWVSGLGGQLTIENGVPTIYLLHDLVATDPFPNLAPVGAYLDKLVYTPKLGVDPTPRDDNRTSQSGAVGDPIEGIWICDQDPSITLTLQVTDTQYGFANGTILLNGSNYVLFGFTDTYAMKQQIPLQSVSLSVIYNPVTGYSMTLAGSLSYVTNRLSFTVFQSRGTASDAVYVQTTVSALTFHRA